jgi:hypothetical protein
MQPQGGAVPSAASPDQQPDNMLVSGLKGAAEGFGRTVLGGQQLVGKGLEAVGAKGVGGWLERDAQQGIAKLRGAAAADREAHPYVTGAGELLGGAALPGGAVGKAVSAGRPILQGAISGGVSSLLDPVEKAADYWTEKARQVGIGSAAGAAFGRLARVVGAPSAKGVTSDAQKLINAGVKLTPGQMIGGAAKGLEEKATSIPVTGHFVGERLHDATKSFNIATINQALAPIGAKLPQTIEAGRQAVSAAGQALSTAYNQILPKMTLRLDQDLVKNMRSLVNQSRDGTLPPDLQQQFEAYLRNRVMSRFQQSPVLTGDVLKQVESDLSERARRFTTAQDPRLRDLGDALNAVKVSLRDAMERQNPNFAPELQKINHAYAMFVRVQNAAQRRAVSGGVFTPGDLLAATKVSDKSVRKGAFARGDALLQDWAETAQKVIGNRTPDSGTAGRLRAMDWLGIGAGAARPDALLAAGAASLPYTKIGGAAVRTAGPPVARAVGKALPYAGAAVGPVIGGGQ